MADRKLPKGYVPAWALSHKDTTGKRILKHKPHMPCWKLCSYINRPETMWRPHVSCLMCPKRRYHYGKLNKEEWVSPHSTEKAKKKVHLIAEAPKNGSVLPVKYQAYFLIINLGGRWGDLRNAILRPILTFCEWLAQW